MRDMEVVPCYDCDHAVDEHDEHARCLTAVCPCGWDGPGGVRHC